MTFLSLAVALILVGLVLWAINAIAPPPARTIFSVLVLLFVVLWFAQSFGLFGSLRIR